MRANMKDVANKAGVSAATVSHVINETRFVKKETIEKVKKAMNELNYHPNYAARSLRSQKSKIIGFLVPDIANFFFTGVARSIEKILRKHGYNLIFSNSDENSENEKAQLKILKSQMIDGLIMAPTVGYNLYEELENKNFPIVFIDRKPKGYQEDCVLVDNFNGSYEVVKYLINKGHSKIGIITGLPGLTTTEERLKGYKEALYDSNMEVNQSFIKIGDSRFDSGYKLAGELFENTDITALYVTNNMMTIGAMELLKEKEVQIPEQLAIIGFDDYKWASITAPPLSVIKQPIDKIGQEVTKLLLNRIEQNESEYEFEEIRLKTKLVIRESS